jgi:hypothetical protein
MKLATTTFNFLVAAAVLAGCGGGGGSSSSSSPPPETTSEGVTKAFNTGVVPTLNADAGLSINDTDSNGVRDDVDALIKSKYTVATDINAAIQFAKALQMTVSASSPAPADVPTIATATIQAVDCATAQMGPARAGNMIDEIRAATVNTKDRFMAYRETQAALSGQHAVITEDDPKTFCK